DDPDVAAIRLVITSKGFAGHIALEPYLDFDVHNKDANYGDQFWERLGEDQAGSWSMVSAKTKKTSFVVSSFMQSDVRLNGEPVIAMEGSTAPMKARTGYEITLADGDRLDVTKYVVNLSSLYVRPIEQPASGIRKMSAAVSAGYERLRD